MSSDKHGTNPRSDDVGYNDLSPRQQHEIDQIAETVEQERAKTVNPWSTLNAPYGKDSKHLY